MKRTSSCQIYFKKWITVCENLCRFFFTCALGCSVSDLAGSPNLVLDLFLYFSSFFSTLDHPG